jgi:hypothetical protein
MKRLTVFLLVLLVAAAAVAPGQGARGASKMTVTLRIIQGVTQRIQAPPDGDAGDTFWVDLTLFTTKNDFNAAPNTRVGHMRFSYLLHGSCAANGNGCSGTVDITTTSKLPGGTLTASIKGTKIRQPFVVKIKSGTGRFKGAKGTIVIAPDGAARNVYNIRLP